MELIFSGLAILISEEKESGEAQPKWTEGEIVFLDPSVAAATPEALANAGRHNPLLIVRNDDVLNFDGGARKTFPLEGAVSPEWFDGQPLAGFAAISLRRSVAFPVGVDGKGISFGIPGDTQTDFRAIDFVPSLNDFNPGLTLSKGWRDSPHITTRFVLGAGDVGSDRPIQRNVERLEFTYGHQPDDAKRRYSDVIRYVP